MNSNRLLGLVLLAVGVALGYHGYNATESPLEQVSKELTGHFSDETMAYLIAAGVSAAAGLFLLLKR